MVHPLSRSLSVPKIKTNRGARKRFKLTATGKAVYAQAFKRHILTKKSSKRKRNLRGTAVVSAADTPNVRKMLGYK
jgi:large subunit ribosomal protein L35